MQDTGDRMQDTGCKMLDIRCWMQDDDYLIPDPFTLNLET